MHLLTALREALLQAHRKEVSEYRKLDRHIIREAFDAGIGPPGNWETKCEAEAYSEMRLMPHLDDDHEVWDQVNELLQKMGWFVYREDVNAAVTSYWPIDMPGDYTIKDDIRQRIKAMTTTHAQRIETKLLKDLFLRRITSPIEQLFYAQWELLMLERPPYASIRGYELQPQVEVDFSGSKYRLDFAVLEIQLNGDVHHLRVGIECDSYQFHDRDPKQFEHEKKRERHFQDGGWKVFHYAGSEVTRDPEKCVRHVIEYLEKQQAEKAQEALRNADRIPYRR